MRRGVPLLFAILALPVVAQDLPIYVDGLQSGFQNVSYNNGGTGASNFSNPNPFHDGAPSISFVGDNYNAVSFAHPTLDFTTAQYPTLRLFVHGGTTGNQQLRVFLQLDGAIVANAELDSYIVGGPIAANAWREVRVVFAAAPLAYGGSFDRIDLQSDQLPAQAQVFFDDVTLLGAAQPDAVFLDGFEGGVVVPPSCLLAIENDVAYDAMLSERYTWCDSLGRTRKAVLAHNDQNGPGGTRGGELRRLEYETGAGTRIVRASGNAFAGFGYVVSHTDAGFCTGGGDTSSLGHFTPGTWSRVFSGRHHAILRFTQNYPRYCTSTAPATQYNVPVTIDWLIATGRDHPLWALTWDLNAVPVNALEDDSRAPYGELLVDGAATEGAHSVVAGVGWGDRFKFASTTAPVTLMSDWTWNVPNTIPYAKLWTTAVDATMGTVQTQTIVQQDAGGYFGTDRWNTTSAGGNACAPAFGNYRMPCDFNWPYQIINYSFGGPNAPTNNTRLAWGTNFGFLGQASYPEHGFGANRVGWPRQSYSVFVVLGRHSVDPIGAQVAQIETVQATALTAAIGTVRTSGPAGVARPDNATYAPAGWNHVYAAWAIDAAANQVDANFNVGAGTLAKPLVVVSSWTAGALPGTVRLGGVALVQDVDYFPSLRAGSNELWITLNRDLVGMNNKLEIQQ